MSAARQPPGRRRPRWLVWTGVAVLALPLLELAVVVAVGRAIGGWQTLVVLLAISVLGVAVLRREGPATWRRFRDSARAGRTPSAEMADGVLVLAGGVLLVLPGLVSDALGLLCVLPVTRPLARRALQAWAARVVVRLPSPPGGWGRQPPVVEGEVLEGEVLEGERDDEDRPRPGG